MTLWAVASPMGLATLKLLKRASPMGLATSELLKMASPMGLATSKKVSRGLKGDVMGSGQSHGTGHF